MRTFDTYEKKQILITCKTYPRPSDKYEELVCVAGITAQGEWIRLAPLNFRKLPYQKQFKKYQVIEAKMARHSADPRPETFRPHPESIRILGDYPTRQGWGRRNQLVLPLASKSAEHLQDLNRRTKTSLGLVKVGSNLRFLVKQDAQEWTPKQAAILKRENLFGDKNRPLDKVPWTFFYSFKCDSDSCPGHVMRILDWEIHELYRSQLRRKGSPDAAVEDVRRKYEGAFSLDKKNLHLFLGTHRAHLTKFMIVGVYYPPL